MDQQTIIVGVLVLVAIGVVAGILFAPTKSEKSNRRLAALETSNNARRAGAAAQNEVTQKEKRKKLAEALSRVEENKKKSKKKRYTLEQKFEQAGLSFTVPQFYIASAIAALFLGLIGLVSGQKIYVTVGLVFVGGFGLPHWYVGFCIKSRQKKFAREFSNAIDVIVRGVKSGLPVNECLKIIAKEAPRPVNEEFEQLIEGIRIGLSLEQSLERMHERMPLPEVRFFGIVLMIQQQTGGNLAEALGNLAGVLRGRKNMEGKIKALSAEAKASAMIIGALPFLVMGAVKIASPDYLDPLFLTQSGNFILICAGFWFCTGVFVMRNMTQIKV